MFKNGGEIEQQKLLAKQTILAKEKVPAKQKGLAKQKVQLNIVGRVASPHPDWTTQ